MAAIPKYIQDLISQGKVHAEQLKNLENLTKDIARGTDLSKEAIAGDQKEIAVLTQKLGELAKRIEEWDRRWWSIVVLLIGALLSLASGLVVTILALAKK